MATLRLLTAGAGPSEPGGEVASCAYTPDGAFVLSGGFDGRLRLWEATGGTHVTAVVVSPRPVTACTIAPDGKQWLAGTLEGILSFWDAVSHEQVNKFLAHPRPISAIRYSPDEQQLATSSWDGTVTLWKKSLRERESKSLPSHKDIAAGCAYTPDGKHLLSWSYDGSVRLWELARAAPAAEWTSHRDRVTAGAVSPDGRWAATGGRDGSLKVWDLKALREVAAGGVPGEVRCCRFLLDGQTLAVVDVNGRLSLHGVTDLKEQMDLITRLPVQCADLAPTGGQLALGCGDGRIRFVAVDGFDSLPLVATVTQTERRKSSMIQRLLGKSEIVHRFTCVCPVCRQSFELPSAAPDQHTPCPHCQRHLRVGGVTRVIKEGESP